MNALVTGASGGLGAAVVQAFLDAGAAKVSGVARAWKGRASADGRFQAIDADLSRFADCERAVADAGDVDVLVHTMGGFAGGDPVGETNPELWHRMFEMNLTGAFYMFRAVLPGMTEREKGRILAVGSRAGVDLIPNYAAYSVSKAALVALVKNVALETRNQGITANIVMPSTIDTVANRAAMPGADYSKWVTPESIARQLVWLASDAAGDVSGAVVPVYGRM